MMAEPTTARRLRRVVTLATIVAVPLVVWPGLETPFSTPKLWWLFVGSTVALLLVVADPPARQSVARALWTTNGGRAALAWLVSFAISGAMAPWVSREALLLGLAGPVWWAVVAAGGASLRALAFAHATSAIVVAVVVLLQRAGFDPFAVVGLGPAMRGGSERLAMYATLGNPNFVAAWLAMAVPMTIAAARAARREGHAARAIVFAAGTLLSAAAIAATGSRGGALGLAAGLCVLAWTAGRRARRTLGAAAVLALVALPLASPARPLRETIEGRLSIWRVTAPHLLDRPLAGWGVGAFELVYDEWHRAAVHAAGPFRGPQQHAHNDVIEAVVERGLPGLLSMAMLVFAALAAVRRVRADDGDPMRTGPAATVVAALAVACVDFPIARPAEVTALWLALGMMTRGVDVRPGTTRNGSGRPPGEDP